jgi:uncharacterized protein
VKPLAYWFLAVAAFTATACNMSKASEANHSEGVIKLPARNFIDDQADLLTPQQEDALVDRLSTAYNSYGPYLMVVTVKSLKGQSIEDYSLKLARRLAIGDAKRDDGLLLLVAPNERRVRIEVGYGLEASFTDPFCKKIIEENIIPLFKQNYFPAGINAGVDRIIEKMKSAPTIPANDNTKTGHQKDAA